MLMTLKAKVRFVKSAQRSQIDYTPWCNLVKHCSKLPFVLLQHGHTTSVENNANR